MVSGTIRGAGEVQIFSGYIGNEELLVCFRGANFSEGYGNAEVHMERNSRFIGDILLQEEQSFSVRFGCADAAGFCQFCLP
ncbi:hypothetical protein U1Q18_021708, partial [Sarracenia purpurea var. burkii]